MDTSDYTRAQYLNLLKNTLTRYLFDEGYLPLGYRSHGKTKGAVIQFITELLGKRNLELVKNNQYNKELRKVGKDWPATAETMIGLERLDNIEYCIKQIIKNKIEGDLIETGTWRGGASIFMMGVLKSYGIKNKTVWVADSFEGLPVATEKSHLQDIKDKLWTFPQLSVSMKEVKNNFAKYDLLDKNVRFIPGWFKDTLPNAPIKKLSLLRLDGDMYESTIEALEPLYPKLSKGGYVIVDDYCLPQCRKAINDYRKMNKITSPLIKIDWASVYWKK